jgi:hypothetical protein
MATPSQAPEQVAATHAERQIARPLHVLVPLIKDDLTAALLAGMPYHRAAGEKLLEAKEQLPHGSFGAWVNRNFQINLRMAQYYMSLVKTEKRTEVRFSTMDEFRRYLGEDRGHHDLDALRQAALESAAVLRQAELERTTRYEQKLKLAKQLIDIGYKVLAAKLHPDKGGSPEAMTLLNEIRSELKQHPLRR